MSSSSTSRPGSWNWASAAVPTGRPASTSTPFDAQASDSDPKARPRLVEIIANLNERIQEARLNGWLGEVEGLTTSRDAAARKLTSLDRTLQRQPTLPAGAISLPVIVEKSR